jgi:hypothetical protein
MSDLKLSPDHDIDLLDQTMTLTDDTNGESIAQRIKITLWLFLGEYFFDESVGVPYFQQIFQKGITASEVDNIFKTKIRSVPGVLSLTKFTSEFNKAQREYKINFTVLTSTGSVQLEVVV